MAFAGCIEELEEVFGDDSPDNPHHNIPDDEGGITDPDPEPELLSIDLDTDILGAISGEAEVLATVRNHGGPGEITIEVDFTDASQQTIVDRYSKTATIREDEQRRYTIEVSPPSDAEHFRVRVDTA